jgi:hypothetical protein
MSNANSHSTISGPLPVRNNDLCMQQNAGLATMFMNRLMPWKHRGRHHGPESLSSGSPMSTRDSTGWWSPFFDPPKSDPRDLGWGVDEEQGPLPPQVPSTVPEDPEEEGGASFLAAEHKPLCSIKDTQLSRSTRARLNHKHDADRGSDRVLFRRRRPDFVKVFGEASAEAERLGENRVAVLICGNRAVRELCLKQVAAQNRSGGVKFDVHCEAFSF